MSNFNQRVSFSSITITVQITMAKTLLESVALVLQPSLLIQLQYSIWISHVPDRTIQYRSSLSIPGVPNHAQLRIYLQCPFTFCLILRHIDALNGMCGSRCSLQSVIGNDVLSNGSAHLGSASDRHTQHLIENTSVIIKASTTPDTTPSRTNRSQTMASLANCLK